MSSRFLKGVFAENPVFRLLLGLCPVLGVTTTTINGFVMGVATALVLLCSNITVSLIGGLVPQRVRVPVYLVIIATYVSIVDMSMRAFAPSMYEALGVFVPLIVVNCLLLKRAEGLGDRGEGAAAAIPDALGMGTGFLLAITLVGGVRQFLSAFFPLFGMPPGAFLVLGLLFGAVFFLDNRRAKKI